MTELVGRWTQKETDPSAKESVSIEFFPDGNMIYETEDENGGKEIILMTYQVDGDSLLTDQPSAPRQEKTKFSIIDGELKLEYGDSAFIYRRV